MLLERASDRYGLGVDSQDLLLRLDRELARFESYLSDDLSAPVEHCGDWTLFDLAEHLGRENLWAAAAVTERRGDYTAADAPRDPAQLAAWFNRTAAVLLETLNTDPSLPAWTFYPPHTVGFWQRRRCLETLVHRWDAEHALGMLSDLDSVVAGEGIAEVIDTFLPRQIERGRVSPLPHAVRLVDANTDSAWVLGSGTPVATVRATAADLLLLLWGRLAPNDHRFTWQGDRHIGHTVLATPLVP